MKTSIKKIFHPYWLWEEVKFNMWGSIQRENREKYLQRAVIFTGNHRLYGCWMLKVARDWKYSCEHNLSCPQQNRKAWIGHAACAYAFKCPEDIVRKAWWMLDEEQRRRADAMAEYAIKLWEMKQCQKESLISMC